MSEFSHANKHLQMLVEKILHQRGVDLRQYKESFLRRRLDIRLRARGLQDYSQYASLLDDPSEYSVFFETLSINVTEFLRDKDVFDTFYKHIIPKLIEGKQTHEEIRIWSAGCASGEEVYSIAILLHEALDDSELNAFKVIGTDISPKAIQAARRGRYKVETLWNLPRVLQIKYFESLPDKKHYEICKEIRESVSFSVGDLSRSVPTTNLDVIFCRNMLMYLEREAQHKIFATFYRSLKKTGYLVLGKAETIIGKPAELFEPLLSKERIYRKRESP